MCNVAIVARSIIPSITLCGHSQLEYLEKEGKINYRFIPAHIISGENLSWADVIIFLRSESDIEAYACKLASKANKHLVYVLDDDLLNAPDYLSSSAYYNLKSTKNNIRTIMSLCDTFLTSSPVLLKKYGGGFKNAFLIDEPSLNKIESKPSNNTIKIGFAGSIDRTQDISKILKDAIKIILDKYKNKVEIEFMGAKPDFVDELELSYIPYQPSYESYTAYMSRCNWDIGLAPMPDTEFHSCKYYNKFIEYASFGIAGIYSNLEPYIYGIKNKENGLLANNTTEDWVDAISKLIDDEKLRKSITDECLRQAKTKYSLEVLSEDYFNKITTGYTEQTEKAQIANLTYARIIIFFKRVFRKIQEQGIKFPSWLIKKLGEKTQNIIKKINNNNDKKKLFDILSKQDGVCVVAPYFTKDNERDGYEQRVKRIDETVLSDKFRIYLMGEDRLCENVLVNFVDSNHAIIKFNSFETGQLYETFEFVKRCKAIYIHSVIRFMPVNVSNEMFKIFDFPGVKKIWDVHGSVPEEYKLSDNTHNEIISSKIEKSFYEKADIIVCVTNSMQKHLEHKYGKRDVHFVTLPIFANDFINNNNIDKSVNEKPVVIYSGGLQKWQNVDMMIDALKTNKNLYYKMFVTNIDDFKFMIKNESFDSVEIDSKKPTELLNDYVKSDYGFVLRDDIVVNNVACPTKLIEYIKYGIVPIYKTENIGDFKEFGTMFVKYEALLSNKLPTNEQKQIMINNNKKIIDIIQSQTENGISELKEILS